MSYKKGVDVSKFQGEIDWETVKASGIDFAIIQAGLGQGHIDPQYERNISECNRLGIPCGVYWFSYAYTPEWAAKEAEYCLSAIAPYKLDYPICFDFEYDSVSWAQKNGVTVTKELATEIVTAFCGAIEATGHWVMNYSNPDFLNRYFDSSLMERFDLWYAQYPNSPDPDNPPRSCGIWQYTSAGSIDGISGSVDCNAAYKDYVQTDIKESEDEDMATRYNTIDEVPEYAKVTVQKLVTAGALKDGNAATAEADALNLSEDMLRVMVINDRMGLYK